MGVVHENLMIQLQCLNDPTILSCTFLALGLAVLHCLEVVGVALAPAVRERQAALAGRVVVVPAKKTIANIHQ